MGPLLLVSHVYILKYYVQMKVIWHWDSCPNNPTEGSKKGDVDEGTNETSLAMSW